MVEFSVRRLAAIIERERQKHEIRKNLLAEISDQVSKGQKLLSKAEKLLGADDPIVSKLQKALSICKNAREDIANFIERGKMIGNFQHYSESQYREAERKYVKLCLRGKIKYPQDGIN